MKYNVEYLLEKAFCEPYFDDTNTHRVYEASMYKAALQKNKRKHRLIPVLACVAAALVFVVAVPPVRAAVANFFESVGTYMSSGPEERPAVAGVSVQTPQTGKQTTAPGTENWMDGISVEIQEAIFDGENLYLNYTLSDPNQVLTPEEDRKSTNEMAVGETVQERVFSASVLFENGSQMVDGYDYRADYIDGTVYKTTMFMLMEDDSIPGGQQDAILKLNFANRYVTTTAKDSGEVWAEEAGTITLPFTIQTNTEVHTVTINERFPLNGTVIATHVQVPEEEGLAFGYSNKSVVLDGTAISFNEVKIKSTEIVLRMDISPPKAMSYEDASDVFLALYYKVYAEGTLLPDAYIDYTEIDEADNTCKTKLTIPFPPKEIRELKLVPCLAYTSSVDGKPVSTNGTFEFPETGGSRQTEQLLTESSIVLDLSK